MRRGLTMWELVVMLAMLMLVGCFLWAGCERLTCKHGRTVRTGGMDCYGGESYKHCEPATEFICDD